MVGIDAHLLKVSSRMVLCCSAIDIWQDINYLISVSAAGPIVYKSVLAVPLLYLKPGKGSSLSLTVLPW